MFMTLFIITISHHDFLHTYNYQTFCHKKKKKDSYPLRFIIILLKFQNYGTLVLEYGFVIGLITLPFLCISAQPFKYDSL